MFETPWIAALAALFLWWFATGILLWRVHQADKGGPDQHLWSVLLSLPLFAAGTLGVNATLADPSPQGVWLAFLSALALWGWVELAFLSGVITGPNTAPCPERLSPSERFWAAFRTVAWHEALLVTILIVLALAAIGAENSFAFWTFLVLFLARVSAKLNLYLGVPRINTDFLPTPLAHLASYFRQGPITGFFPLSVTLIALAVGCFLERLWRAHGVGDQGMIIGFTLLSMLTALALLEHWFMVWRVRDDKLWRWMIPAQATKHPKT
ncbi:MAG: putative photosynthetic complex assembly protein PuhE [Roseinatronobacter sp.]